MCTLDRRGLFVACQPLAEEETTEAVARWTTLKGAQATRPAATVRGTLDRALLPTWATNLAGADIMVVLGWGD